MHVLLEACHRVLSCTPGRLVLCIARHCKRALTDTSSVPILLTPIRRVSASATSHEHCRVGHLKHFITLTSTPSGINSLQRNKVSSPVSLSVAPIRWRILEKLSSFLVPGQICIEATYHMLEAAAVHVWSGSSISAASKLLVGRARIARNAEAPTSASTGGCARIVRSAEAVESASVGGGALIARSAEAVESVSSAWYCIFWSIFFLSDPRSLSGLFSGDIARNVIVDNAQPK